MAATADLPADLKPIGPYLQRANELKGKDDVVAYWCTYYAAKVGIGLKVRTKEGRAYLMRLMDTLEKMKVELDESDALGDIAGQAYVENFALRVFEAADAEDRSGRVTKTTAMKFIAAACFLEVLNVFDTMDSEFLEKTRYAKWRAGQIAKAFREGRDPAPPPGVDNPVDDDAHANDAYKSSLTPTSSSVKLHSPQPSPQTAPNVPLPESPHPGASSEIDLLRTPTKQPPPRLAPEERSITPGMWSTVATPGLDDRYAVPPGNHGHGSPSPSQPPLHTTAQHGSGLLSDRSEPDEDAWSTAGNNPMSRQNSWSTTTYDEDSSETSTSSSVTAPPAPPPSTASPPPDLPRKHVRFTPSVVGGSEASTSPTQSISDLPEVRVPSSPPARASEVLKTFPGPPPLPPSVLQPYGSSRPAALPPPPPVLISAPSAPYAGPSRITPAASAAEYVPPPMTPQFVAAVQKHCKFAISALDYEDAETARRELRAALAMLGD